MKSCVHIHGVYPYMYIPIKEEEENIDRNALILGAALEEALKSSLNDKNSKFVHKIIVVSGM